ncbi:protein kinase subdomain-containing protein PKL/CAK/Fmp29 [Coprinopsis cinerea okayama7|uniref:Protein kinase subdomain-containing protein PKL/CAK/Fmp29 n=1 Tax=Coprinopsis cinerea (strain Okayama-7 / 130 / ATCC MYA-4618 / FGSC 9003) TaxID=240176 RepID=A8PC06_COPC7|nr:protein kinase subdomain-containing protein PKL/CAK/Fmp29 [Coprinopsis cinerea okayama7\|eukprot:XP_001840304.2 protein kinase subdomain-containing protein PKL/CAK/Fmp29 [Coprinopsis cinerea okayama7\
MLHIDPCSNAVEHGLANIYKQAITGNNSLRVNFDYNAALARLSSLGSSSSGSNSVAVSSSLKGESSETSVDKNGHLDTTTATPASTDNDHPVMKKSGQKHLFNLVDASKTQDNPQPAKNPSPATVPPAPPAREPLEWDWDIEHEDRKREKERDATLFPRETPFEVDRRLLKDVVREKMGVEVGRIKFLSAGTFHKAYLIILVNHEELVARVARRFMPRLKVESEVATISYLRQKTNVPVPKVYHYDSNPYNRLGGEFILMSKAPGIPLSRVYHGLAYNDLVKLVKNLARIVLPLFAHRFSDIGSLYFGPDPRANVASGTPTPKETQQHYSGFPFSPTLGMMTKSPSTQSVHTLSHQFHVGPIISWPFFGSNRGELVHPTEMNRGPWPTLKSYLESCVDREIKGVIRENEGRSAPHRLHLDPDEIRSSRHHKMRAVPGDESDDSDEYSDYEDADEDSEWPGSSIYSDFRRMQRTTFLVAHMNQREEAVRKEMGRWKSVMERLVDQVEKDGHREEFGLDCHDLSLENVFVDPEDNTKITCIIDWESTTTRPLWACAHVPACIQSSAFVSKLFREAVAELPSDPTFRVSLPQNGRTVDPAHLCREWLYYEAAGARLRMAHRCAEWDGWEEGLVDSILGPEEFESEWFKPGANEYDMEDLKAMIASPHGEEHQELNGRSSSGRLSGSSKSSKASSSRSPAARNRSTTSSSKELMLSPKLTDVKNAVKNGVNGGGMGKLPPLLQEQQREKMLNQTGDICGGRGGELGLRLEAWLCEKEKGPKRWKGDGDEGGDGDDESEVQSPMTAGAHGAQTVHSVLTPRFER